MALANEFLNYKGLPLVRCGDVLYYGNTADKYVIRLTVLAAEKTADIRSATKVLVELIRSESVTDKKTTAVKSSEKAGLYEAMDIGSVWLKRALSEK